MRGLAAAAAAAGCRRSLIPSSSSSAAFSSFSGIGGGGAGRGRGRGAPPPPPPRAPGRPPVAEGEDAGEEDPFSSGRGRGGPHPVLPSSPLFPSSSSFSASGRGRGGGSLPPPPASDSSSGPKKPIFMKRFDSSPSDAGADSPAPLPSSLAPPVLPGSGRGGPPRPHLPATPRAPEDNRHLRRRTPPLSQTPGQPKLTSEEAVKRAMEVLSRGDPTGGPGRGRGRGVRGRGRGRGGRRGATDEEERQGLHLGDNADGERLEKRLGEEKMKILDQAFEEATYETLPSPMEDAYLDALHTNNLIEYEPEYLVNFDNPDIDEKPPMSLEETLEKAKPFLIAYEGIQNQEEWEEAVKDVMERLPHMKELIDMYCGPDRVTAKQQEQELERVASTLPEKIPSSVKRFTDRALLSLKSNPGWGFDKKCQFMDKLVWEVQQHYK